MARYIDANELQKRLEQIANESDYLHDGDTWDTGVNLAGTQVDLMPTADVVEVKHGKWLKKTDDIYYWYECSECSERPPCDRYKETFFSDYCPHCGAKMDGERRDT